MLHFFRGVINEKLKKINDSITLQKKQPEIYTRHFENLVQFFISEMKTADKVFEKLISGYDIAGISIHNN